MSKTENQSPQQGNLGMEQHNAPSPTKTEPVSPTPSTPQPPVPSAPPAFPVQLKGLESCFISPKKAFIAAGGTEQQFAREVNFAMQAMLNNPYLIDCARQYPDHLVEAIKNVSLTGLTLNPELRLGYLVPYKGKVKFQASYMGKVDILIRTGVVKDIYSDLVYANDEFCMTKGTGGTIIHKPNVFGERGDLLGGYYFAVLTSGVVKFDAMPKARIEEIKSRSEAVKKGKQSPWDTDFEEMARKTIVNWAFKFLPKTGISDSMIKVLETESQLDDEMFEDWKKAQGQKPDDFEEDDTQYAEEVK